MTNSNSPRQAGFGAILIIIVIVVLLVIAAAGVMVYNRSNTKDNAATNNKINPPAAQPIAPTPQQPANGVEKQYEGMTRYTNDKYGISFYYPDEWTVEEIPNDKPVDPIPVELGININANTTDKYKTAVLITVVAKDYQSVANYYDGIYQPRDGLKVSKVESTVWGKQSTHWTNAFSKTQPSPTKEEHYLFAVGNKTHSFSSLNAELNVQRDSDYWKKFDKVYKSLQLR